MSHHVHVKTKKIRIVISQEQNGIGHMPCFGRFRFQDQITVVLPESRFLKKKQLRVRVGND